MNIVVVIGVDSLLIFSYVTLYFNIISIRVDRKIALYGNAVRQSCIDSIISTSLYNTNAPKSHLNTGSICKYDLFEIFPNLNPVT